jgi:hypothetical protein
MSETAHPTRAVFVVDWDGTCVEEVWPGMGDWLPGAVEALREMSAIGKTVIYSLRCHLYEMDDVTLRPEADVREHEQMIRSKLDCEGLHDVEVYPPDRGKPPGKFYVDDRAVRFTGDWREVMEVIRGTDG